MGDPIAKGSPITKIFLTADHFRCLVQIGSPLIMELKKRNILLCFFAALLLAVPGFAQQKGPVLFKDGDIVSFIGNSITHSGGFHNHVLIYYATRFPNEEIIFLNAGISGDNANDIFRRLEDDIMPLNADWSIVMVGMNDVNRALYAPKRVGEAGLAEQKQIAIQNFRNHLDRMLRKLSQTGTKIVLQTPSIYDQTAQLSSENYYGVNDALKECTAIVEEMAKKYDTYLVDYWQFMTQTNEQLQQQDPTATIISIDRVHPWGTGDLIMAYRFLKETGVPSTVSELKIQRGAVDKCKNCEANVEKANKSVIEFQVKSGSLPFPVEDEPQTALALELVPFIDELNREVLTLNNLRKGTYSLSIDNILIDHFTHEELAQGVNLAQYRHTPQYQQALEVREIAADYRKVQRKLRDIKLVQNRRFPVALRNAPVDEVASFIATTLDSLKASDDRKYIEMKRTFDNYLELKHQEGDLEAKLMELTGAIYETNKPTTHNYVVKRLSKSENKLLLNIEK